MARKVPNSEFRETFDLEDLVIFPNPDGGDELKGRVVRVYNDGSLYHVLVKGERYQVESFEMRLAPRARDG